MQTFKQFLTEIMDRDLFVTLVAKTMTAGPVYVDFMYDLEKHQGLISEISVDPDSFSVRVRYFNPESLPSFVFIDDVDLPRFKITEKNGVKFLIKRDRVSEEREIYAKKIKGAPKWSPAVAEHDYKIGPITFSAGSGLGSVPLNRNIWHEGAVVMMKPSVFMKLAHDDEGHQEPTSRELEKLVGEGYAIGIPFLEFIVDEKGNNLPRINGHEGRGRMRMIIRMIGDEPIPVHMRIGGGLRSNYLAKNPEVVGEIKQGLFSQSGQLVRNPVDAVYVSMNGRDNVPGEAI